MTIRLGDIAPNFTQDSNEGPIDFYEFLGDSWGILFSHPADYTPVCTTELGRTALLKAEFEKRFPSIPVFIRRVMFNQISQHQNKSWFENFGGLNSKVNKRNF